MVFLSTEKLRPWKRLSRRNRKEEKRKEKLPRLEKRRVSKQNALPFTLTSNNDNIYVKIPKDVLKLYL